MTREGGKGRAGGGSGRLSDYEKDLRSNEICTTPIQASIEANMLLVLHCPSRSKCIHIVTLCTT